MASRRWNNVTKIAVATTLVVLAIILLVTFRTMISSTIVAFLLAFILSYPVNWIQRRTGWARGTTVAILYIVLIGSLVVTPAYFFPRIGDLGQSLQQTIEELISSLQSASSGPIFMIGGYELSASTLLQEAGNVLQNVLILSTRNPLSIFRGVTTGVLTIVYVLVLNFWLLKDLQRLQRLIIEQIPGDYQEEVRRLSRELGEIWHAFLRGQLVLGFTVGMMTWIALTIVGMPNAGGLALLAGFLEFLPTIGPGISGTIGTAVALFQGSTWMFEAGAVNIPFALVVVAIYAVITQIESVYLIPRLVGGRVKLHPAVTFVGIINGAIVFGVLGVLLATPVIASARVLLTYVMRKLSDLEPFESGEGRHSGVRIPGLIAGRKIDGIIFDLDGTLTQLDMGAVETMTQATRWLEFALPARRRRQIARRLMIRLENLNNFADSQLWRFNGRPSAGRMQRFFNQLRGYPPTPSFTLFEEIPSTLAMLKRHYQLALVTTRKREEVDLLFETSNLRTDLFDVIITREDVNNLLPNSEALMVAAEMLELESYHVLVVSDSDPFLRSGAAASMATAGVLSGLSQEQDLQSADVALDAVPDLTGWL